MIVMNKLNECMFLYVHTFLRVQMYWESVQEALQQNQINVDHVLFNEVKKSKRTTLCVVLGSLSTSGEGKLDEKTDATGELEFL